MKTIILEDGTRVEISDESYKALQKAVQKPNFVEVVQKRMPLHPYTGFFKNWGDGERRSWLNNEQSQKELEIYLYMLLWKDTYDKNFVPDWEDGDQKKYNVFYTNYHKRCVIDYSYLDRRNMQVYVSSKEKAEQMLKDLKSIGVL